MKSYFHLDMDAFFVSVEELFDPSLKGKPVVVGGRPKERGVVSAASYAARKFGVHSAMPLRTAYKLCPQAIFVEGHRERYVEYSGKVYEVLQKFSPRVEMASIDEAYLDLTGTERLLGPPLAAAHGLHNAVRGATNLNCSIGAASSRLVAKIASDQAKPHGILWIPPGCEARFLAPLDVRKIPGVGKVTERSLHDCGVRKIGDLARLDRSSLEQRFGKWGLALAGKARGEDTGGWFDGEIGDDVEPRSISHEHTFSVDTADRSERARSHAGPAVRNGVPPPAGSQCARRAPSRSNCVTRISPRLREPVRWNAPPRSIPKSPPRSATCSIRTGRGNQFACWASMPSRLEKRLKGQTSLLDERLYRSAGARRWPRSIR